MCWNTLPQPRKSALACHIYVWLIMNNKSQCASQNCHFFTLVIVYTVNSTVLGASPLDVMLCIVALNPKSMARQTKYQDISNIYRTHWWPLKICKNFEHIWNFDRHKFKFKIQIQNSLLSYIHEENNIHNIIIREINADLILNFIN